MEKKIIISIDFDGTIVEDRYPEIGWLKPGAVDAIREMNVTGEFYIIVNTCRQGDELVNAVNFLLEKGIPFDRINDNHPDLINKYGNVRKVHANYFIDASNVGGMPDWHKIPEILKGTLIVF
jgi:hypothetical protein